MRNRFFLTLLALLFVTVPLFTHALMRVSEIMYDLEGADTGREWVEVKNEGSTAADISSFKLFEANVNHGLTLVAGSPVIPVGGFAIIADNATKFLADWPGWSGTLFDSSFSLSNTGETIGIRNGALGEEDTITYTSDAGAGGDGKTLARNGNSWAAGPATPGAGGGASSESEVEEPSAEASTPAVMSYGTADVSSITAYGGENRTVIVGARSIFEAESYGLDGAPLLNARYVWSFGNGVIAEGRQVLHQYDYPGKYVVILSVTSGDYSATDRVLVEATPAKLAIRSETDGSVAVFNKSGREIDLGWWILRRSNVSFVIPKNTIVLPGEGIRLSDTLTHLPSAGTAELLYPNGAFAVSEELKTGADFAREGLIERIPVSPAPVTAQQRTVPKASLSGAVSLAAERAILEPENNVADERGEKSIVPWLAALTALIGIGAFGVWYIRRLPTAQGLADQFQIIDITEKD